MLQNEEFIEQFKKSLSATVKSIGKSDLIEINFVADSPSIDGHVINLIEPNLKNISENLNYIRAEADSMALEIRFHKKNIHEKYLSQNDISNDIFNAFEKSRIETQGSDKFKGIKSNIFNKHELDLQNKDISKNHSKEIINAFRYVSYSEFTGKKLGGKFNKFKKIIQNQLGSKYTEFFSNLKNNISNQENFADQLQSILKELGYFDYRLKNDDKNNNENENKAKDQDTANQDNPSNDQDKGLDQDFDKDDSTPDSQLSVSSEGDEDMGEDSQENELDYFPKIETLDKLKDYKFYTNKYDEIIKAEDLCDLKELDRLRLSLDQQVFHFKPLIAKIANRLQRKLQAQQNRQWEFNLEEGYLDTARL